MRAPPSRSYQFTGERRRRVGRLGENAPGMLAMDSARGGRDRATIAERVSVWLKKAGIASSVVVDPITDRHYELRLRHPVTGEIENIADAGYGVSQVVPVLVGGYSLDRGDIYVVEEPEIHLHPRAQSKLGDFIFDLYTEGVQCVFETHSEHMILRRQQHIAAGNIPPEDVAVYYVHAPSNENKTATRLDLDSKGQFTSEWPEGFFPERLNEAKELARIRHKQLTLNLET